MSQQLLLQVLKQAEVSEPAVRAAALLHIARVLARTDQGAAERVLERGIALARDLEGRAGSLLLGNAVCLAAAISARQALPLYAEHKRINPFGGSVVALVNTMAQHGHIDDAIAYLRDPLPGDRFPLHFVNNLARECRDDEDRMKLLELAIREWKSPAAGREGPEEMFAGRSFSGFFSRYWSLAPREVATSVLKELVPWALGMNSEPRRYPLSENLADPDLASEQEFYLLQLMPVIESLAPELARFVVENHPQVSAAFTRFPRGMESVREGQPEFDLECDDVMTIGDSGIMPMTEAIATDFERAFQEAYERLAEDSASENPDDPPKECWPSTGEFRNILYKAGQHLGNAAAKLLSRIPDPDLRLFAQIELCAAIAGLPQMGGLTTVYSRRRRMPSLAQLDELFGRALPGIRCPKCNWTPRPKNLWTCKCGHHWNTFETRGLCPGCQYQWEITACLQCGARSPHQDWYD